MPARPLSCQAIQAGLFDFLSIGTSDDRFAYDFPLYLIGEWADEEGESVIEDATVDELSPEQRASYVDWLRGELPRLIRNEPLELPAYVAMRAERILAPGTWLAHFTRVPGGFSDFDRGTTLEAMHLSTHLVSKAKANCKRNLADDASLYDVVFGFAFTADEAARHPFAYQRKYGSNVVIFQSDCAVLAYHDWDDEHQAVFPVCSEYNVIALGGSVDGSFTGESVAGEDIEFDSLRDALAYVQRVEPSANAHGGALSGAYPRLRRLRAPR